jgi:hypothetical protein
MHRFKPSLAVLLLLLGLTVLPLEAWLVRREHRRALSALAALEQKKQERDWLARQSPAPNPLNAAAIAVEVEESRRKLARLLEEIGGGWGATEPVPDKPVESYFALTHFGQRMRERAIKAKVALKPGEHFGFASHANEGPAAEVLRAVHRQVHIMEYLVDALLEAGPKALLSVKRTFPKISPDTELSGGGEDYCVLPPALSLPESGLVETDGFRLEFTGSTTVLRLFLNTLARSRRTAIVRTVEAEPLVPTPQAPAPAGHEAWPVIRAGDAKFVVTIEVPLFSAEGETGP